MGTLRCAVKTPRQHDAPSVRCPPDGLYLWHSGGTDASETNPASRR